MIDTHAHITKEFFENPKDIIKKSKDAGVSKIIVPATTIIDSKTNPLETIDNVYYAVGIHPTEAVKTINKDLIESIIKKETIAIGECGLDYYRPPYDINLQKEVFKMQIAIALDHHLPLIVHTREALEDTYRILLKYYKSGKNNGVIHSAAGDLSILKKIIDLGFYVSFNGISTFKNAQLLKDLIYNIDIKNILVETDSPFLTPEPKRGEYPNTSLNLIYIINNINNLKGISNTEDITTSNAQELFRI
jgi:TatD DNase family protein